MANVARFLTCAAVIAAVLTGCGTGTKPEPTPTPSSSAPSQPTEKNLSPTGGNSFSPTAKAPPAQTVGPGRHRY